MHTIGHVIRKLVSNTRDLPPIPASPYSEQCVMLAVHSMSRHMTDEGWQLQLGLQGAGYTLVGHGFPRNETNVGEILGAYHPTTLVIQDKREWDGRTANNPDPRMRFRGIQTLRNYNQIFKVTVLKDAHNEGYYHRHSAEEMGVHAWIVYYHPYLVQRVAPWIRLRHCIRIYHSVNPEDIPQYDGDRPWGCLLSGAISGCYPLRMRLARDREKIPACDHHKHPGYHANGSHTPDYLKTLSRYKVALCTCSKYGYALRRIFEATACGCRVITDLPADDVLPVIDTNLIRISPVETTGRIAELVAEAIQTYNPEVQHRFATAAQEYYDYRVAGRRLAQAIQAMKLSYREEEP